MAQDLERSPISDDIEGFREAIDGQQAEIREALAEELGGSPDDYRAKDYLADQDGHTGVAVLLGGTRPTSNEGNSLK